MIRRRGFSRGFGVLAVGILAAGPALAAEGEFLRDAMSGIGLIEPEKAPITYNERAPLVMPPNLSGKPAKTAKAPKGAPKSAAAGGAAAGIDPNVPLTLPLPQPREAADPQWPKDPEISRREREAVDSKKPIVRGAQGRMNDNNETLSVRELERGRRAGAGAPDSPVVRPGDNVRESTWLNPLQLFQGRKEDEGPSEIEPERDALTAPPTGYRKAPLKVEHAQGSPIGGTVTDNSEADPRAYMRAQGR